MLNPARRRERAGHFFSPTPRRPADNINVERGGKRRDGGATWRGEASGGWLRGWISASELIPPPGCTCVCVEETRTPKGGREEEGKKEVKREGVGERGRGDEPHGQDNTF